MDPKLIENILEALDRTDTRYFKVEDSKKKIEIVRSLRQESQKTDPQVPTESQGITKQEEQSEASDHHDITSPYVGFFRRSESKDGSKPVVKLREVVNEGKIIAYIQSMSLQYEVISDIHGKIVEVLVEDGQAVEYGQPLFRLKLLPDDS
ncbi:MAG: acetyl-CoA carboxylase biotin carboxyl carrier protein [bacterium]|nr:MAG: acetyl-CoA carboxylase biotin carboxyl carrier protein [bacterium]